VSLLDHNTASPTFGGLLYRPTYPAYGLLNAKIGLIHDPTGMEVDLYGHNLTNRYYVTRYVGLDGIGTNIAIPGAPREVGLSVLFTFGPNKR
jgi:hypothetical protein